MSDHLLGIDLAVAATGWALVASTGDLVSHGTIRASRLPRGANSRDMAGRDCELRDAFQRLPWDQAHAVIVEFPGKWLRASKRTSTKTIDAMIGIKHILGIVHYDNSDSPIHFVDPNDWQPDMLHGLEGGTKQKSIARAHIESGIFLLDNEADALCMTLWWRAQMVRGGA